VSQDVTVAGRCAQRPQRFGVAVDHPRSIHHERRDTDRPAVVSPCRKRNAVRAALNADQHPQHVGRSIRKPSRDSCEDVANRIATLDVNEKCPQGPVSGGDSGFCYVLFQP
jgi:hypothetical protein